MDAVSVRLVVNGAAVERDVEPRRSLADFLRADLGLTGTHLGCEQGACGACTVLLDGHPVRSCLVLAASASDREVETVESLAGEAGAPSELQLAFSRHLALQCGFCTPGFLMLATAYLRAGGSAEPAEVREAMAANLCRCTGYGPILAAVSELADGEAAVGP